MASAIKVLQTSTTTLYQVNGITFPTYGLAYRKAAMVQTEAALKRVSGNHYNGKEAHHN